MTVLNIGPLSSALVTQLKNDFRTTASVMTLMADAGQEMAAVPASCTDDGPAIEYADGTKAWYRHDKLHRREGPALEYPDGRKEWYHRGKCHRGDGPAIEYARAATTGIFPDIG